MKGLTVRQFYDSLRDKLDLKLVAGESGLKRRILISEINRPGLALSGYVKFFASRRGQVLGKVEISYLRDLPRARRKERISLFLRQKIPFCVVARNYIPPPELLSEADRIGIPIFRSSMITTRLLNLCTMALEEMFAPSTTVIANLVEVYGVGVLILGKSGVGKSECTLSLVERGHRLVSDDYISVHLMEGTYLLGEGSELTRFHMEIRGLGIIDVRNLFGVGCVRQRKRVDLAVTLEKWDPDKEYERLGLDEEFMTILGIDIPHIVLPVGPGRDLALLIEVAALNHRIKRMGYHAAKVLDLTVQDRIRHRER
ncbi:MAG: HPr(Ser) kinase/phosphatase [Candidatus Euphemobacter frigidus]|nr:HPr(Ser) kinase/phosphatase [Candidatus Euphemobacter frigidus]MDP8275192.1 HPr(Ser) kinase/phosphatase [Candidatus Euphemobacter frigidus]